MLSDRRDFDSDRGWGISFSLDEMGVVVAAPSGQDSPRLFGSMLNQEPAR